MKIHIIGCSGSGKSYLAEKISKKFDIPHYDLDNIFWDINSGYNSKRNEAERNNELKKILELNNYIIEGVYYSWLCESFEKADKIYLLKTSNILCKIRILRRFIRRKLGIEKGKNESVKSLLALLKWTDKFQKVNMKEIEEILSKHREKVIKVTSKKQIAELFFRSF